MAMNSVIQSWIDVFTKQVESLGKGVYIVTPYFRDYNFFSYLGFGSENFYLYDKALKNSEAMKYETKFDASAFTNLQFKPLGELEGTVSDDGKAVRWYEQGFFNAKSSITTAVTAGTAIIVADIERFAVDQLVATQPAAWSIGTETTAKVTAVDLVTSTVTVDVAVTATANDYLIIIQQLQTVGSAVVGTYTGLKDKKLFSVFGKLGSTIEFALSEVNTQRFFMSPSTYMDNKIKLASVKIYTEMANVFFKGTNVLGIKPISEWLDHVVAERDANALTSIVNLNQATEELKLDNFADTCDLAAQSPIYMNEEPVIIANQAFASKFASALRKVNSVRYMDKSPAALEYGLKTITTPFTNNKEVIIVKQMNNIYGNKPTAFIIPKHLITFKQPLYTLVPWADWTPTAITNAPGKILILPETQVTWDKIKANMEYYIANLFAWQTYDNSYFRINWL